MLETILFAQRTAFPPPHSTSAFTVVIHVAMLLLVFGSLAGLFLTTRRRTRLVDLLVWPCIFAVSIYLASIYDRPDGTREIVVGFVLFVTLISILGFGLNLARLVSKTERKSRVVITIVSLVVLAFVIALLLPATPSSREASRRTDCKNRMRQIAIAMHNWHDRFGRLPDLATSEASNPSRSWRVELLTYLDRSELYDGYRKDRKWDDVENLRIAQTKVEEYQCPSASNWHNQHDDSGRYFTHYFAVTGPNTVFPNGKGMNLSDISEGDGTSRTLLLVEATGRNVVWTDLRDADVSVQPMGINIPGVTVYDSPSFLSTYHPAGVNGAMADASVFTIPRNIDPKIIQDLTTTNGNEPHPSERGF